MPINRLSAALHRVARLAAGGRRLHPLHVHISVLFTLLILATGAVIGWYNYSQTSNIILSASDDLFERVGRETVTGIERIYRPIGLLTDLMAGQQLTATTSLAARLARLPELREALAQNPAMSAFYVGYGNGDFFLVRPLPADETLRKNLNAPPQAVFLVQSVDHGARRGSQGKFVYLDQALRPLTTIDRADYRFDPRTREWYALAMASDQQIKTRPYVFFTTREPGITFARRSFTGAGVVGADVTLADLSGMLKKQAVTPSAELVLFDDAGQVLAYTKADKPLWKEAGASGLRLALLGELGGPVLDGLINGKAAGTIGSNFSFEAAGRSWIGRINKLNARGQELYLGVLAPHDELLRDATRIRMETALITLAILLLAVPIVWLLSRAIARSLRTLSAEAAAIQNFNFDETSSVNSIVREIDDLAQAMEVMRSTIRKFLEISSALAAERDLERLLGRVLAESLALAGADTGVIYLLDDDGVSLYPAHVRWRAAAADGGTFAALHVDRDAANLIASAAREGKTRVCALGSGDADETARYLAGTFKVLGAGRMGVAAVPLHNRQHEVVGVLAFARVLAGNTADGPFSNELIAFVEALSGTAAVSIEARRLLKAQKDLLDAFIQLIAGAIDAKSPYTGGHCQRVPELTVMLARAACDAREGPYRDFSLSDDEWEAVHIASWLHDCGKVTTPEYVVDKATKLETIGDRIHEIRTRFEVLKRDAEIEYWKAVAGGGDRATLKAALDATRAELDADYAFIAECNIGGEFMAPGRVERVKRIAQRTWLRTLDDRIGISWEERQRMDGRPAAPLPAPEHVLADKPEHVHARGPTDAMPADNSWGFKLATPAAKFNKGEIYNLCIGRGTLTEEERYKINDHIAQTIIMLSRLPFPRHLKNVPEIAGGHHEKMDGTGYPKRLTRDEMSPVARMMAIADIFEALTAADRPYKKGKTLSESIKIMGFMKKDSHIDPELFELFLTAGVYRRYAEKFMRKEQIDEVDIRPYLSSAT